MTAQRPSFVHLAEDAIGVKVADAAAARRLAARLTETSPALEPTQGLDSVFVQFDPARTDEATVTAAIEAALSDADRSPEEKAQPPITVRVRYGGEDGPDLADICARLGMSEDEFVRRHTARAHLVELVGFMPGFAYMSGLDARLDAARLKTPRARVPAGSIGISAGYTGAYALASPGGWPLVGRAVEPLFDASSASPLVLSAGRRVRFAPA